MENNNNNNQFNWGDNNTQTNSEVSEAYEYYKSEFTKYEDTDIDETFKLTVQVVYGKLSFINTSVSTKNNYTDKEDVLLGEYLKNSNTNSDKSIIIGIIVINNKIII